MYVHCIYLRIYVWFRPTHFKTGSFMWLACESSKCKWSLLNAHRILSTNHWIQSTTRWNLSTIQKSDLPCRSCKCAGGKHLRRQGTKYRELAFLFVFMLLSGSTKYYLPMTPCICYADFAVLLRRDLGDLGAESFRLAVGVSHVERWLISSGHHWQVRALFYVRCEVHWQVRALFYLRCEVHWAGDARASLTSKSAFCLRCEVHEQEIKGITDK